MKKILKLSAVLIVLLIVGAVGFLTYITKFLPNVPVEEVKIEYTPERIERGRYLANNVAQCVDCHSERDWSRFAGPIVPGSEGKGGEVFDRKMGLPGAIHTPNITPFHLKDWSDGELFRAITAGVSKDGRPLFPIMPYPSFAKMDREDIYAIIAYLRTLPEIENKTPPSELDFPMSVIVHTIPKKAEFTQKPSPVDKINYGAYLTNAASCIECHTQMVRGQLVEGKEFAGGRSFPLPDGSRVISSNITPDKATGIGFWSEELFIQRFKAYDKRVNAGAHQAVKPGDFNTIMPWTKYAEMTNEDLAAIFAYLQTLKPVSNKIGNTHVKP
ncbi:MAG: cytochrome c [Acidobacteriota bacterium]|nr:cytochrome c [Acidobacteriota bacterium]